jgi:DNA-binding transcriptional LysR family regulator
MQLNLADRHLAGLGLERRVELTIESFLLVPLLVRGTSLVSLVLERSAALQAVEGVVLVEPPVPVPDINEAMYWDPRHTDAPAHRWLRGRVAAAAAALTLPVDRSAPALRSGAPPRAAARAGCGR